MTTPTPDRPSVEAAAEKTKQAVDRAIEIVHAIEWSGDMRVNMTTVIGAGRVLAKAYSQATTDLAAARAECERLKAIGSELVSAEIDWQHMTAQQQREYLDREKVIRSQAAASAATELVTEEWCRANGLKQFHPMDEATFDIPLFEGLSLRVDTERRLVFVDMEGSPIERLIMTKATIVRMNHLLSAIGGAK